MADPVIERVHSMTATSDAGVFNVDMTVSTDGAKERLTYVLNEQDPYGMGPMVKEYVAAKKTKVTPYTASAPNEAAAFRLEKTVVWSRMTEEEAEIMEQSMMTATAKERQTYAAAPNLNSGDPVWEAMKQRLTAAFGANRAEELLARD